MPSAPMKRWYRETEQLGGYGEVLSLRQHSPNFPYKSPFMGSVVQVWGRDSGVEEIGVTAKDVVSFPFTNLLYFPG